MDQIKVYTNESGKYFFAKSGVSAPFGYWLLFAAKNIADAVTIAGAIILAENQRHYGSKDSVDFVYAKLENLKDFNMEIAAFQVGEELKKLIVAH